MAGVLLGLPSKNIAPSATPSWQGTSANSSYPVVKVLTLDPGDVAKATTATGTLRLTWGGAQVPVLVALINTNLGGATVTAQTNGGMSAVPVTIEETEHGLVQNGFADFRGLSGVSGTQLDIAVSAGAPGPIAIGTILVFTEIESPRTRWDYQEGDVQPTLEHRSSLQQRFIYRIPVNVRTFKADGHWAEDRPLYRSLRRETYGSVTPFLLIPDEDDLDARLVQFRQDTVSEQYTYFDGKFKDGTERGIVVTDLDVEEVSAGVALR